MIEAPREDVEVSQARLAVWREHPDAFVLDNWPFVKLEPFQEQGLQYCGTPGRKRLGMQSSAGTGKTAELAWAGLQRLACFFRKGEYPKGVALSVDRPNLEMNLWPELCKWLGESPYLKRNFSTTAKRIYCREAPEQWFLEARSWAKKSTGEEQAASLSGLHSLFPFALVDECSEIDIAVADRAEQMFSTCEDGLVAIAGNPLSRAGMLYECCVNRRSEWHVIEVTSDPDDPNRCGRVDAEWARKKIEKSGRDDPWVMVYVLGKFPEHALMSLLTPEEVEAAMARSYREEDLVNDARVLGVDVAGQGLDASVICPRRGLVIYPMESYRGLDPNEGAVVVARKWASWDAHACFVDNTGGFGAGWIAQLRNLGYAPFPVEFAGKPSDPQFYNKRAEMWWRLREAVLAGASLPQSRDLLQDLTVPTYTHKKGKLLLEEKDSIRQRLPRKRSPDEGDAAALTYASEVAPVDIDPFGMDGRRWPRQGVQVAQRVQELPGW